MFSTSCPSYCSQFTDIYVSLTPGRPASYAHPPLKSNHTATLQILTAAMAATQTHTKDMGLSMAQRRLLSSRANLVARPPERQPRLLLQLRRPPPVPGHVLLFMGNVVV